MTPSRKPPQHQDSAATDDPVVIADGGREDTDEDWRWNPAVDEEPIIESSDDSPEESDQSQDSSQQAQRSSDEFPYRRQQPPGQEATELTQKGEQTLSQTESEPKQEQVASMDDRRISRRGLLLGGAGVVGTAAIAGGWFVGSGERTGAKAVAETYLTAISADDWDRAASVYHDEARPIREIEQDNETEDYESYLANNDHLELYEALDPTIDSITVRKHFPDLNAETVGQSYLAPTDRPELDAWKQLVVILTIDTETVAVGRRDDSYADALAGDKTKGIMLMGTVSENSEWFLWGSSSQL